MVTPGGGGGGNESHDYGTVTKTQTKSWSDGHYGKCIATLHMTSLDGTYYASTDEDWKSSFFTKMDSWNHGEGWMANGHYYKMVSAVYRPWMTHDQWSVTANVYFSPSSNEYTTSGSNLRL